MELVLELVDNASDEFKRINRDAVREVDNLRQTANRAYDENKQAVDKLNQSTKFYKLQTDTLGQSIGLVRSELSTFNSALSQGVSLTDEQKIRYEELKNKLKELGEESEKAGDKAGNSFQEASKKLQAFRKSVFVVTAAMAVMVKGLNDAAQYNEEAKNTNDNFNKSLKGLSATLGQIFAPAIEGLTFLIDGFRLTIESALGGFIKLFSFVFEFLGQLPVLFKNVFDNVKNVFTKDDDPIGIVEAFRQSFQRALDVANIATDQIVGKMEETRQRIQTGTTLDVEKQTKEEEAKVYQDAEKAKAKSVEDRSKVEAQLRSQTVAGTKSMLQQIASENKAAGIAFKAISIVEAIIATAKAVTKALPNLPLAAAVGAMGAAQVAIIASQKFHQGGVVKGNGLASDEVPVIAQTGEGFISRRGMRNIGGEAGLSAINSGNGSLGGRNFGDINIYIGSAQMSTSTGISRTAEMLGSEIEDSLRRARSF